VINSASFFVSAFFIGRMRVRPSPAAARLSSTSGLAALSGYTDLVEGFRYVRHHSHVAALMFVKAGWGLAGGILLLLTIFGQRVFPVAGSTAAGIGVLCQLEANGEFRSEVLRWMPGYGPADLANELPLDDQDPGALGLAREPAG